MVLAWCVGAGAAAPRAQRRPWPTSFPAVEQGEILIRPTGHTRLVRSEPAENAPAVQIDESPRFVTIGYMVRDESERGHRPQIHYPMGFYAYPLYSAFPYTTGGFCGNYGGYWH